MGKGKMFAAVYVVGTVVLFFIMLYLMTTINPPFITVEDIITDNTDRKTGVKRDNNTPTNDAELPVIEPSHYGIERIEADDIDFYQATREDRRQYHNLENITSGYKFKKRKIIAPLWPRTSQTMLIDPTNSIEEISKWPTTLENIYTLPPSANETASNITLDGSMNTKDNNSLEPNKTIIKSIKRRSINNNNKVIENPTSVILRILDNEARSRIEIKLGSGVLFEKRKDTLRFNGNKPKFTMESEIDGHYEHVYLLRDTVISIMPNDSIIIHDPNGKTDLEREHTNIKDLISSMILEDENNEENNNELPLYEYEHNVSDYMISDNKTNYLKYTLTSSNFNMVNSNNINMSTTIMVTMNNNTNFGTMATTEINDNNTEVNNQMIGQEKPGNIDTNKQSNDTSNVSDHAIYNNYTDTFHETNHSSL